MASLKRKLFGQKDQSSKFLDQALARIRSLQNPDLTYDPLTSQFGGIQVDPRYGASALRALTGLERVANQGGITAIDRARIADIQDQTNSQNRGSQEAILQHARERGVGGSGLELVNRMISQQEGAGRANRGALDVAAQAQQRALDAMSRAGEFGSQLGEQEFGRKSRVAQAQDAIAQFNNQNRTNLAQQAYENEFGRANAEAGIFGQQAQAEQEKKRRRYGLAGNLIGAGATVGASFIPKPGK